MLYKYMKTVPKVNNKDWRISMNCIWTELYMNRSMNCTSLLRRAEFSSSTIGSGKFQQISIYCCRKGYSGTLEPGNTCCWRQTVILEFHCCHDRYGMTNNCDASWIIDVVNDWVYCKSTNIQHLWEQFEFLENQWHFRYMQIAKTENSITPRQGMRCWVPIY